MQKLYAPDGVEIVGTVEIVPAVSTFAADSVTRTPSGTFEFDYTGNTDVYWNGQRTVVRDGQRVFEDQDGCEHLENTLLLLTDEEWEKRFGAGSDG